MLAVLTTSCLLGLSGGQQVGKVAKEQPPSVKVEHCTLASGCKVEHSAATLDANWRWTHDKAGYKNCFTDGEWSDAFCQDSKKCAATCAVEGVDKKGYRDTYGVTPIKGGVELQFVADSGNVGTRLYLIDGESYKIFKLKNREFTFDVDASALPCGLNGALYFVEMDPLGDKGVGENKAGAAYGTGYCDAQCPHDIKWTKGVANVDWKYGTCCAEMDIWEANSMATAYTAHPCEKEGAYQCEGATCGDTDKNERYSGVCDKDGCDLNSFRMGDKQFYGAGSQFPVDSTKPMTVVTQFLTSNGTDEGDLVEIRQLFVQGGQVIARSNSSIPGVNGSSITDEFCSAQKAAFSDPNDFGAKGGLKVMGEALDRGMVLVLSLWDDGATEMRWLDSKFPTDRSPLEPGVARGPCDGSTSSPKHLRQEHGGATVRYSHIMHGEIGSTFAESGRRLGNVFV